MQPMTEQVLSDAQKVRESSTKARPRVAYGEPCKGVFPWENTDFCDGSGGHWMRFKSLWLA
jgi:hypothetical protein